MSHRRICYCCETGECAGVCLAAEFTGTYQRTSDYLPHTIRYCECDGTAKLTCLQPWTWGNLYRLNRQDVTFSIVKVGSDYIATLVAADREDASGIPTSGRATWTANLGTSTPDPESLDCTLTLDDDSGLSCFPSPTVHVYSLPGDDPCNNEPLEYGCILNCDCDSRDDGIPTMVAVTISDFGLMDDGDENSDCASVNGTFIMEVTSWHLYTCSFSYSEEESGPIGGGSSYWRRSFSVGGALQYTTTLEGGSRPVLYLSVSLCSSAMGWGWCPVNCAGSKVLDGRIDCRGGEPIEVNLVAQDTSVPGYCVPGKATFQVLG
jgi:hypothetical protein